jgi:DMSO/TMAO reductase YedYZ molybdopterin-dependent catalytic subunit
VRVADVVAEAGIEANAQYVTFLGADTSTEADPPQQFGPPITAHKALAPRRCWRGR